MMRWWISQARNRVVDVLFLTLKANSDIRRRTQLCYVGSDYGGYWLPVTLLNADSSDGALISAGLGLDVTFDVSLLRQGFTILALDPLADSVKYAESEFAGGNAVVIEAGLWTDDGMQAFYRPRNREHDSWSMTNLQETDEGDRSTFRTISLESLMGEFPDVFNQRPLILKMNIEGAEHRVLVQLIDLNYRFDTVLVHLESVSQVRLRSPIRFFREVGKAWKTLTGLRGSGYELVRCRNLQMVLISTLYDPIIHRIHSPSL